MFVGEIINRRDVGTLASFTLQARESLCLSGAVSLAKGRVHEVMGDSADMFAVLVASQLSGPIIWTGLARDIGSLAPTALQDFIDPARVILTEGVSRGEVLWASAAGALRAMRDYRAVSGSKSARVAPPANCGGRGRRS